MKLVDAYDVIVCVALLLTPIVVGAWACDRWPALREARVWHHRQANDLWATLRWLDETTPRCGTVQNPCDPSPKPRHA